MRSDPDDLRNVIEVTVARVEREIVLENQRRDPDIVDRYGCSLTPELPVDASVVVPGLVVGVEHPDSGRKKNLWRTNSLSI